MIESTMVAVGSRKSSVRAPMHQIFVGSVTKQLIRVCPVPVSVDH